MITSGLPGALFRAQFDGTEQETHFTRCGRTQMGDALFRGSETAACAHMCYNIAIGLCCDLLLHVKEKGKLHPRTGHEGPERE
jgi:hypothetical protein